MKVSSKAFLYVKAGCPRCREVLSFFSSQGVEFKVFDISENKRNMDAMISSSGQTKVPTFEYEDLIVADFSIDEFLAELREFPEISQRLGIGADQS